MVYLCYTAISLRGAGAAKSSVVKKAIYTKFRNNCRFSQRSERHLIQYSV